MKFLLIFLVVLMSIAINLSDSMIARFGVDPDYLILSLLALVITGLIAHHRLALIILVLLMCVAANLPADYALSLGIDRDLMTAGLVAVVITPYVIRWFEQN